MTTTHAEALANLVEAVRFQDRMREAARAGEQVTSTGIAKDAREWLDAAARTVVTTAALEQARRLTDEEVDALDLRRELHEADIDYRRRIAREVETQVLTRVLGEGALEVMEAAA